MPETPITDPLSLAAGATSRLVLVAVVLALLWGAVAWAMTGAGA